MPSSMVELKVLCAAAAAQCAAKAEDPYFHEVLYSTLIGARATPQLLQLDSPRLERWLRGQGGLDAAQPGIPIGPLQPGQARMQRALSCACCTPGAWRFDVSVAEARHNAPHWTAGFHSSCPACT